METGLFQSFILRVFLKHQPPMLKKSSELDKLNYCHTSALYRKVFDEPPPPQIWLKLR